MDEFALRFPGYGFERHKGYGTAGHVEAVKRLGPCAIHRRSFEPIKSMFATEELF
jgi:ribonuclease HII